MSILRCHYCSRKTTGIPVVLWDGETYCSSCVDAIDPELSEYARTHADLVEILTAQDLRLWRAFTRPRNVGIFLVILGPMFGLFFSFLALAIAQNEILWCCWGECCLGVTGLCVLLMFLPFEQAYYLAIDGLPRTVRVSGQKLVVETPYERWSVTLARCDWFPSFSNAIGETEFLSRSPTIILHHPKRGYLAVGVTPKMYRVWYAFLTLSKVRNRGRFPGIQLVMGWMVGIPSGMGLGVGLGRFLKDITGDGLLPMAYGLLGALDGFCIPIFFILGRWFGAVKGNPIAWSWKLAGRYAFGFGMLGVFVVGGRGVGLRLLPSGLPLILLNTCIGFFVGWWCGRYANQPRIPKKFKAQ
jgi:hypothetical protein